MKKKILAILMASSMVMGMSVTAFASTPGGDNVYGTDDDLATIAVNGVEPEEGLNVTAYQIIAATYDENTGSFSGYNSLYPNVISNEDIEAFQDDDDITQEELNAIIESLNPLNESFEMQPSDVEGQYTADVPAGTYLVMIEKAETKVYNPVVISADYVVVEGDNELEGGTVTLEDENNAWVKVSDVPTVDKVIDDGSDDGLKGDSADIGDIVNYDVTISPIPNYGGDHPVLNVVDTLSAGLDFVEGSLTVKIDGVELNAGDDYTLAVEGQEIKVDFVVNNAYTLNYYVGKAAVIEYQAKVTANAVVNEDGNNNDVVLNYSKDSKVDGNDGTDEDKTYTYTFDIDGSTEATNKIVTKTGEDEYETALPDAVFGLYTDAEATEVYTNESGLNYENIVSDSEGQLYIKGLEEGTYYLKEISAPEGYSVNTHIFTIDIVATYNDDGTLASWTYTIDSNKVRTITVSHDQAGNATATPEGEGMNIENTKLVNLPSTGGIGTTIFTIGGIAIMVSAAGLFFANKRKKNA